jgi:proline iminopeptidase
MENYVKNGSANIWTEINGIEKDQYVILCSGGPGCCDYLSPVSQMIEDKFNVIRFEQRGCGRSDKDNKYDIQTVISDIEAIRKYYQIDKLIIGGHSFGANLSLIYSLLYPKNINSIIFIAGIGFQNNREWLTQFFADREKYGEIMPKMNYPFSE